MVNPRKPVMLDAEALSPAPSPQDAPLVEDAEPPQNAAMQRATRAVGKPKSWLSRLFWGAIFGLLRLGHGSNRTQTTCACHRSRPPWSMRIC